MAIDQTLEYHFLYASSLFANRTATEIQTVLGSCVAVCLYDIRKQFGGMNHYMLPLWKGDGLATAKFGNIAIEKLVSRMLTLGAKKEDLVAKIFGGADQLSGNSFYEIGKRNILVAEDELASLRIPIVASSTGGAHGRKIVFHSGSGQVFLRFVNDKN